MSSIVVVEGQPRSRERIVSFVTQDGHQVTSFADAKEAFDVINAADTQVAAAIVTWDTLGSMSGAELLARLKQQNVSFPRIVISPIVTLQIRNRAFALGATDLLLKPIDGDRLREAVRQALEDPAVVDPLVTALREELIGDSKAHVDSAIRLAQAIRSHDTSVLLIGESGIGKEVFARLLHEKGRAADRKLEAINLAGLSPTLIESELFGHEKGAFTGADREHRGAFERAEDGTLFLDEIGYLEASLQPKLLRVIEQRKFMRVGGGREIEFTARLVCATSRNLAEASKTGAFREDLYYRISEFEIRIAPLRERIEDLVPLVEYFLRDTGLRIERTAMAVLQSYSFPGNVRELQNVLKQARAVCKNNVILPGDLPGEIMHEREDRCTGGPQPPAVEALLETANSQFHWSDSLFQKPHKEATDEIKREFDRIYLVRRIEEAGNNRERAAELMGISPKTLRQKLKDCGLKHLIRRDESDTG